MDLENEPLPGRYQHYKGPKYEVVSLATHSETLEEFVVYYAVSNPEKIWVRPRTMFLEKVIHNGITVSRFAKC